jgi:hypothetical protein
MHLTLSVFMSLDGVPLDLVSDVTSSTGVHICTYRPAG